MVSGRMNAVTSDDERRQTPANRYAAILQISARNFFAFCLRGTVIGGKMQRLT
jgi:hypothetical protein